ncbi:unnamed protein product [Closterium sp. NIES-64]|nr:unnamed protein product [Closterium sp. NIES-64]
MSPAAESEGVGRLATAALPGVRELDDGGREGKEAGESGANVSETAPPCPPQRVKALAHSPQPPFLVSMSCVAGGGGKGGRSLVNAYPLPCKAQVGVVRQWGLPLSSLPSLPRSRLTSIRCPPHSKSSFEGAPLPWKAQMGVRQRLGPLWKECRCHGREGTCGGAAVRVLLSLQLMPHTPPSLPSFPLSSLTCAAARAVPPTAGRQGMAQVGVWQRGHGGESTHLRAKRRQRRGEAGGREHKEREGYTRAGKNKRGQRTDEGMETRNRQFKVMVTGW